MASSLVKRYTDYKVKNEQIKARQRKERERELKPFLEDIGRAVEDDRANGHSVLELSALLDNKNRNFLYAAVRAYRDTLPHQEQLDMPSEPDFEPEPENLKIEVGIGNINAYISFDDDPVVWVFVLDNGTVADYPEGIDARYGKPFLKKLIAEVESEAAKE